MPGAVVRIDKALAILGRQYALETSRESDDEPLDRLDREAQESRLLEFVERGDTIAAVTLAKRLYGYDTTEASQFVREMRGR